MSKQKDNNSDWFSHMIICCLLFVFAILCSCTSPKVVTNTDTIYATNTEYVKEYVYDSVWHEIQTEYRYVNDTNYITKIETKYKYLFKHDTVNNCDTIIKVRLEDSTDYETIIKLKQTNKQNTSTIIVLSILVLFLVFQKHIKKFLKKLLNS